MSNMTSLNTSVYNESQWLGNMSWATFETPFQKTHFRILFIICYSVVFGLCIVGNTMVLYAIARSPRLRSMTNFFLANLAVADFSVGAFCVLPNLSTFMSMNWILGKAMCKIYYYVWNVSFTASIIILTVISIERYIAIINPLKARHFMTRKKIIIVQIIIWLIALVYNIPYLFLYTTIPSQGLEFCYLEHDNIGRLKALSLANVVCWYILPLSLIGAMYYKVATVLWKTPVVSALRLHSYPDNDNDSVRSGSTRISHCHRDSVRSRSMVDCPLRKPSSNEQASTSDDAGTSENTTGCHVDVEICPCESTHNGRSKSTSETQCFYQPSSTTVTRNKCTFSIRLFSCKPSKRPSYLYRQSFTSASARVTKARRKVIRLLIAVVLTFGLCTLPHILRVLNHFWQVVTLPPSVELFLTPISFIILYTNSVMNPILYALFSRNFKRSFKETLPCCREKSVSRGSYK